MSNTQLATANAARSDDHDEGQWNSLAGHWEQHGQPLRPGRLDVALYQQAVDRLASVLPIARAVILGVTPEIYRLAWPAGVDLRAIDRSPDMVNSVWQGAPEQVIVGDWTAPHLEAASVQLVMCDGGLHLLDYPVGQTALVDELARILVPGGRAVFRLFLPPIERVTPEAVIEDLRAGRIANMNVLKLRLGHALALTAEAGASLDRVWHTLHDAIGDRDTFFAALGWEPAEVGVIDLYRGSAAAYHFATLAQVQQLFARGGAGPFRIVSVEYPDHLMGDQCPHLLVERRPDPV